MLEDQTEKFAEVFKALGDPTRLRLIKLLRAKPPVEVISGVCQGGPLCVSALAHRLGVTQSAVSQHLRVLRQTGLVRGERRGNFVHYSLDPAGFEKCRSVLHQILGEGPEVDQPA